MKALVTGAGGFLGRYVVEQLVARGDRVRGHGRGEHPELRRLGVEVVPGDLRDRERTIAACDGIDTVFHIGGVSGVWGPWEHYYGINTLGTEHVIAGCRRHGVARLVYTSSPSVTFDGRDQCGVDESAPYPTRWLCHYPHTKALAEQAVLAANGVGGLLTCALRPHLIWGPRDRHLIPRLLDRQRAGQLRRVGNGRNLIEHGLCRECRDSPSAGGRGAATRFPRVRAGLFHQPRRAVDCWHWIDEILALAGLPPVRGAIPTRVAYGIGAALEAAHSLFHRAGEPRMTRFLAAQLGRSHYFDISRARADFGYDPQISTSEGMRRLGEAMGRQEAPGTLHISPTP